MLSIESQERELRETAAKLNLSVLEVLTEAKSAKAPGRPVFNAMMQRLYRGEAAGVICWKLDRLARNPVDGGSVIWAIKQNGIRVVTPAQQYGQGDDNVILMYIEFGMAQKYIDDLGRNVKRGLNMKAEKGWYPITPPPGYLINKVRLTGEVNVVTDPERFPLIRRMWDLMLTGLYNPPRILEIANKQWGFRSRPTRKRGGKGMSRAAIYEVFTKPFYYGWFEFPKGSGHWFKGNHRPMVTEAEYDRVQALLGRKGTPRPRTHGIFPFTGLIRCGGCNGMVTADEKHQLICGNCRFKFAYRRKDSCPHCKIPIEKMAKPLFLHYIYYHCAKGKNRSCTQKSITAEQLEQHIDHYLSRIHISERFTKWAVQYLHELHQKESAFRTEVIKTQQKAYQECVRRIENLVTLKTAPHNVDGSLLSDEEYGRQRMELLKEKASLEELLQGAGQGAEKWLEPSERSFDFAATARKRFINGDCQAKKEILAALGSNLILKDKKLSIQAPKPLFIIENILHPGPSKQEPLEPEKHGSTYTPNGHTDALRPDLCTSPDDDRTWKRKAEGAARLIYYHFKEELVLPKKRPKDVVGHP